MAKIRGFKPDLWTDEDFVELSPFARLLWMGMWNHACDNGHLKDRSKQIKLRVLPSDDVNVAELLRELELGGQISRCDGWITIPNFAREQKPDKRWLITCDAPGCKAETANPERKPRSGPHESTRGHHGASQSPPIDGDGDGDGDGEVNRTPSRKRSETPERFDEFWDTYAHKIGRKKAEMAYRAALKKPGVTPDLLIAAAAAYITWQMREGKHPQFTKHAATWLHGEHWRDERSAPPPQRTRVQEHLALVQQLGQEAPSPFQIGPAS